MSSKRARPRAGALAIAAALVLASAALRAQGPLQSATIVERLGAPIPADLTFTGEDGRPMALASLVGGKPLVISLAYFTCPMLCHLGQDGAAEAFRDSGWRLDADFRAVTVSIDPQDTPSAAREWRQRAAALLGTKPVSMGWRFLVGDEPSIRRLADAVGFRYAYDASTGQYSHATALFVIGADGRVSRYVYGITFEPADIADALEAAAASRRVRSTESFLLRCFHYIPALRQHGEFVVWLLRLGGLAVTVSIVSALFVLWRREARP